MILTTLAPVVTGVGAAVRDALNARGLIDAGFRTCLLVPGQIAWDACDCGQLAVSISRYYYSEVFPAESVVDWTQGCGPSIAAADVTVSILRCMPGPDSSGNPPDCDALYAAAVAQDLDAAVTRQAVACYLSGLLNQDRILGYVIREQQAVGPEGGCGGTDLRLTIGVRHCGCPEV